MRKVGKRSAVGGVIVALVVGTVCLAGRPLAQHFFGFAPSSTGGTRHGTAAEIHFAFDGPLQENALPAPWQSRVIFGTVQAEIVKQPARDPFLRVVCDKSHYVLWYEAVPFDAQKFPTFAWTWRAHLLPPRGDVRTHAAMPLVGDNRNDKALQMMIGFEGNYVLNYVWDSNAPVGFECDEWSPVATIKTTVVDSGCSTPDEEHAHRIDVCADFERRFGKLPGRILGVGISANTNHTDALSDGAIGDIRAIAADSSILPPPATLPR